MRPRVFIPRIPRIPRLRTHRFFSSPPPQQPPPPPASTTRLDKLISRLPAYLRPHAARLRTAPISHIVAFLLLHEITAIVPLFGLFGLFHWGGERWVPSQWTQKLGSQVNEGMEKFERYFRRKGWFGFEKGPVEKGEGKGKVTKQDVEEGMKAEGAYRVVTEVALAYAITKAILPVRILVSLWATPWCARWLVRVQGVLRRK